MAASSLGLGHEIEDRQLVGVDILDVPLDVLLVQRMLDVASIRPLFAISGDGSLYSAKTTIVGFPSALRGSWLGARFTPRVTITSLESASSASYMGGGYIVTTNGGLEAAVYDPTIHSVRAPNASEYSTTDAANANLRIDDSAAPFAIASLRTLNSITITSQTGTATFGGAATLRTAAAAVIAAARPTRSSGACQCGGVSAILASDTGGQSSR